MSCPDDEWDGWKNEALLDGLDPDDWEPLPVSRPIHDVITDLANYQPRSTP
ncbi:hypothetical protein ACIQC7_27815 [Kitasatospora sp. NPDC088556]|uniref:hypothetical protein n=1 Tax=Kitasatospora sp. NPDC088556 TaxID=3364076 RepID=UPI0037FB4CA3